MAHLSQNATMKDLTLFAFSIPTDLPGVNEQQGNVRRAQIPEANKVFYICGVAYEEARPVPSVLNSMVSLKSMA